MSHAPVAAFKQALAVAAFAAVVAGCTKGNSSVEQGKTNVVSQGHLAPTCGPMPTKSDSSALASTGFFSWPTTYVPEYQDDQAFWVMGTGSAPSHYGPLACVVAAPGIADMDEAAFGVQRLVAMVWVAADVPIAAGDAYDNLNLHAGYNCLWIMKAAGAWKGWMVPVTSDGCQPPSSGARPVFRHGGGSSASDYPPVARFVERRNDRKMGVGVYCATNWCSFGLNSVADVDPLDEAIPPPGPGHVRRTVLGWHDQQHLALKNSAGVLESKVKATIVPVDDLESLTNLSAFAPGPVVAEVYFQDGTQAGTKYHDDWGFSVTPDVRNTLALKFIGVTGSDPKDPANWEVNVNGARMSKLHVHYTPHGTGFRIPGTARWRWKAGDEEVWVRCLDGCCHVDDS